MKVYFGFAMSDSMFPAECTITRLALTDTEAKSVIRKGVVSCLNSSHKATVEVMKQRGFEVDIPEKPPVVELESSDMLMVFAVSGLPRLTDRHEYTTEEISKAVFRIGLWIVS